MTAKEVALAEAMTQSVEKVAGFDVGSGVDSSVGSGEENGVGEGDGVGKGVSLTETGLISG
jgi:hypothetical protein